MRSWSSVSIASLRSFSAVFPRMFRRPAAVVAAELEVASLGHEGRGPGQEQGRGEDDAQMTCAHVRLPFRPGSGPSPDLLVVREHAVDERVDSLAGRGYDSPREANMKKQLVLALACALVLLSSGMSPAEAAQGPRALRHGGRVGRVVGPAHEFRGRPRIHRGAQVPDRRRQRGHRRAQGRRGHGDHRRRRPRLGQLPGARTSSRPSSWPRPR